MNDSPLFFIRQIEINNIISEYKKMKGSSDVAERKFPELEKVNLSVPKKFTFSL